MNDTVSNLADELFGSDAPHGVSLAMLVMHRGDVVFERYGVQPDSVFGPGGPITAESTLISWSMDLGAVLCRPVAPSCRHCPLETRCAWHGVGEDPAPGSAGVSRTQARFDGSDRQARGRLMKALVDGAVSRDAASMVMKCSAERAERLVEALAADGLVVIDEYTMCLPCNWPAARLLGCPIRPTP